MNVIVTLPSENSEKTSLSEFRESHSTSKTNAASVYLNKLGSDVSHAMTLSRLNAISQFFGYKDAFHCDWQLMRYEHVSKFLDHLRHLNGKNSYNQVEETRLKNSTINGYLMAIKGVMRTAWSLGQVADGDLLRIRTIKALREDDMTEGRAMTFRESRAILNSCPGDTPRQIRDRAMLMLLLGNGLRRAELTTIELKHVSVESGEIEIHGKGNKVRVVMMIPEVAESVEDWINVRATLLRVNDSYGASGNSEYFCRFTPRDKKIVPGKRLVPHSIAVIVAEHLETAEEKMPSLADIRCHDFRRTFATRLFDKNVDILVIRDLMGHADIATTARYDKRGKAAMRRAMEKVEL